MVNFLPEGASKTKTFEIPLKLTPPQARIDQSPTRFKLIRAGRKFGKSTYGVYSTIKKAGKPNSVSWFCGPTFRQSKLIAWKEFKRLIPREVLAKKPNETDLYFTLKNGSEIYVMGADNPDSLRGPAPDHVVMEEAAMQQPEAWYEVIRPNLTAKQGSADFITTPKGYNWFKDLEDNARRLVHAGSKDWSVFHFTIYDNPYIPREEIAAARKDCGSEAVWRQEYLAEYESSRGRVFSAFSDARHCRNILLPADTFHAYRAIDFGMRDDTACLWGFLDGDTLNIYREHLASDNPASVQAGMIQQKTPVAEKIQRNAIGHDASKQDANMQGLTIKWHFENAGIKPLYVCGRHKSASRHMIQRLLQENRIVIDPNACRTLRKQLLSYEWTDTIHEEDSAAQVQDGNDDAVDALHYMVEMLQFQLFMNRPQEKAKTMAEIWEAIRTQKAEQKIRKVPMPERDEELSEFKFENSPAGYFQ